MASYYVDSNGIVVYYDPATGEPVAPPVIGAPGSLGPAGPVGSNVLTATGPGGSVSGLAGNGGISGPSVPAGPANPLGAGPVGDGTSGPVGGTGLNPQDPQFWVAIREAPPWTKAGFSDFQSWSVLTGQQQANALLKQGYDIALAQAQIANLGTGSGVSRQNAIDNLLEQKRQFNEKLAYDRAVNDQTRGYQQQQLGQNQQQFNANQQLSR